MSRRHNWLTAIAIALCTVPMIAFATAELSPRAHVVLSTLLVALGLVVTTTTPRWRLAVLLISIAVSARYIWYRITHTIILEASLDGAAAVLLLGAESYAFIVLVAGYFQTAIVRRRTAAEIDAPDAELPSVDVFVPSYNEDVDLLRDTLVGAMAMDWPNKTVYLLDDGRRPAARQLAESLGCTYLDRSDNRGAKAGNVNAALPRTTGEFIAFFDADHIPVRTFLRETVGFFLEDPKVALVQTPHYFYNADQFERNLYLEGVVPSEQKLFYHAIQPGNDFWNAAFFCGSCAVIRRSAMVGVGGMAEETLTEDAHTALKMHAAGWRSVYLDVPLAAGIATERLSFYISQRIRWARGMAQVFRLDNPLLKKGLALPQRLNYFAASWHFLFGLPRLVFLIAPCLYLVFGLHPVFADVREVALFALPHLVLAWIGTAAMNGSYRHSFWAEVFETVMAPYAALVTTFALFFPRTGVFKVTTKGATNEETWFDWRHAAPTLGFLVFCMAGVVGMLIRLETAPLDRATIIVAGCWNLYNVAILSAAAVTAFERPQRRVRHRVRCRWRVIATSDQDGVTSEWVGHTEDLAAGGAKTSFPPGTEMPANVSVQLEASWGATPWISADVLQQVEEDGQMTVRFRFVEPSDAFRNALVHFLFTHPESWLHDRYMPDSPIRSVLAVLLAPAAATLGRGDLMRRAVGTRGTEAIVPPRDSVRCDRCSEPLGPTAKVCTSCGEPRELAGAPTPIAPSLKVLGFAGGITLLALALGTVQSSSLLLFDRVIPLDRWTGFTYASRLDQLARAWRDLEGLKGELVATVKTGAPLREDWVSDVVRARRAYELNTFRLADTSGRSAEAALDTAALFLTEAGTAYGRGGGGIAISRLEAANSALVEAAVVLGLPV